MVQLAKFLLEGCDREELKSMVSGHNPGQPNQNFPMLLFTDLISYMKRRSGGALTQMRKVRRCLYSQLFFPPFILCDDRTTPPSNPRSLSLSISSLLPRPHTLINLIIPNYYRRDCKSSDLCTV
jgi:hypothetical protein